MKTRAGIQQKNQTEISKNLPGAAPEFPSLPSTETLGEEK